MPVPGRLAWLSRARRGRRYALPAGALADLFPDSGTDGAEDLVERARAEESSWSAVVLTKNVLETEMLEHLGYDVLHMTKVLWRPPPTVGPARASASLIPRLPG